LRQPPAQTENLTLKNSAGPQPLGKQWRGPCLNPQEAAGQYGINRAPRIKSAPVEVMAVEMPVMVMMVAHFGMGIAHAGLTRRRGFVRPSGHRGYREDGNGEQRRGNGLQHGCLLWGSAGYPVGCPGSLIMLTTLGASR
jgi:hypothetical protein